MCVKGQLEKHVLNETLVTVFSHVFSHVIQTDRGGHPDLAVGHASQLKKIPNRPIQSLSWRKLPFAKGGLLIGFLTHSKKRKGQEEDR